MAHPIPLLLLSLSFSLSLPPLLLSSPLPPSHSTLPSLLNSALSRKLLSSNPYLNTRYDGGRILTQGMVVHVAFIGDWSHKSTAKRTIMRFLASLDSSTADQSLDPTVRKWWNIIGTYKDKDGNSASTMFRLAKKHIFGNVSAQLDYNDERGALDTLRSYFPLPTGDNYVSLYLTSNEGVNVANPCVCGEIVGKQGIWVHDTTNCSNKCWISSETKAPNDLLGDIVVYQMSIGLTSLAVNPNFNSFGWIYLFQTNFTYVYTGAGSACLNETFDPNVAWNVYGNNDTRFLVEHIVDQEEKKCALQRDSPSSGGTHPSSFYSSPPPLAASPQVKSVLTSIPGFISIAISCLIFMVLCWYCCCYRRPSVFTRMKTAVHPENTDDVT